MEKLILSVAFGFIMGGIVAIAGHMDYEDEVAADLEYTMMVCEGYWQPYKGAVDCGKAQAN